jgi:hypothetical protein
MALHRRRERTEQLTWAHRAENLRTFPADLAIMAAASFPRKSHND